jgi:hypothetical protein
VSSGMTVSKTEMLTADVLKFHQWLFDRLCGLVVRVPGYRSRGPGFDCLRYEIF